MRAVTTGAGYRLVLVVDEAPEVFDDLYLGIRAGGALRKKRRGRAADDRGAGGHRPLAAPVDVP